MNKLRIISGKWRGSKIKGVDWVGTRPVTDMIKENIFNIINMKVKGNVLDLFSGSGSLGLEALSRGADKATFNELNKVPLKILKGNIEKLGADNATVSNKDCFVFLDTTDQKFDLIFLDPPFPMVENNKLLDSIYNKNLLNDNGIIVLRISSKNKVEFSNYTALKEKKYGASLVYVLEAK